METRKPPKHGYKVLITGSREFTNDVISNFEKTKDKINFGDHVGQVRAKLNGVYYYIYWINKELKSNSELKKALAETDLFFLEDSPKTDDAIKVVNVIKEHRDKVDSIAINYNFENFGLSPKDCFLKIDFFKQVQGDLQDSDKAIQLLLLANQYDKKSALNEMPDDVVKVIAWYLMLDSMKCYNYKDKAYYQCPLEIKTIQPYEAPNTNFFFNVKQNVEKLWKGKKKDDEDKLDKQSIKKP